MYVHGGGKIIRIPQLGHSKWLSCFWFCWLPNKDAGGQYLPLYHYAIKWWNVCNIKNFGVSSLVAAVLVTYENADVKYVATDHDILISSFRHTNSPTLPHPIIGVAFIATPLG